MNDTEHDADTTALAEVICGQTAYDCICGLDAAHDAAHKCDCGGSWTGHAGQDDFHVVRFPGIFGGLS